MERSGVPLLLWVAFFFCCSRFLQVSDSHALILEGTPGPDELTATVGGSPCEGIFSYAGDDIIQINGFAAISASILSKNGYRAALKYGGDFRGAYTAHALYGEIRIEF